MLSICNNKGCRREREPNNPFCRIHTSHNLLSFISKEKKLGRKIKNVTQGMSRVERLIFTLIYIEELTPEEIGYTLDLSVSSVRKRHRELLDRLSPHLRSASKIIYPFTPDLNKKHIIRIREFSNELITYLAKNPKYLYNVKHRDFERLVAHLLEILGFDVKLTAPVRDGGHDIVAFATDTLRIKTKYIVECKRYRSDCPVGVRLIRSLYGVKVSEKAQHTILATTSYFTRDAIAFAQNPTVLNLHLTNFNEITKWLKGSVGENHRQSNNLG